MIVSSLWLQPQPFVLTGTPLDPWLGEGLPSGLVFVRGPCHSGKSTFLLAVKEGIETNFQNKVLLVTPGTIRPSFEEFAQTLKAHQDIKILLIDDTPGFNFEPKQWHHLLTRERDRRDLVIVTATVPVQRANREWRGAAHFADIIFDLHPVARTLSSPGLIVEARITKHRTKDSQAFGSTLFWFHLEPPYMMVA